MSRSYAKIKTSIGTDSQFAALPFQSQYLYTTVLLVHGSLSSCGVVDWRPNRLVTRASNLTLPIILAAAGHLEEQRYVLFDPDTEEALIRSFIRNDECLRNPKMALSVIRSYTACASPVLRAAVISELKTAQKQDPDYSSWTSPMCAKELAGLLTEPDLEAVGYTNRIPNRITNRITNTDPGADYQSDYQADSSLNPQPSYLNPSDLTPAYPSADEPTTTRRLPARSNNGAEIARAEFARIPSRSVGAYRIAEAFSASLPVPIETDLLSGIGVQIDKCLKRGIPPPAIAAGLKAWTDSDSWSPTQIANFVHKANNRHAHPTTNGKPTEKALGYDAALTELLQEVQTL